MGLLLAWALFGALPLQSNKFKLSSSVARSRGEIIGSTCTTMMTGFGSSPSCPESPERPERLERQDERDDFLSDFEKSNFPSPEQIKETRLLM